MNAQFKKYLKLILVGSDFIITYLTLLLSFLILDFDSSIPYFEFDFFIMISLIIWIISTFAIGLYNENIVIHFDEYNKRSIKAYLIWIALISLYTIYINKLHTNVFFVTTYLFFFALGLLLNRILYFFIRLYFKNKFYLKNNILIIGYNETAIQLASYLETESIQSNIIGFAEDYKNVKELSHYPILTNINDVIQLAINNNVNQIFSTIPPKDDNNIEKMIEQAEKACIRFKIVPVFSNVMSKPTKVIHFGDIPILSFHNDSLDDLGNKIIKRMLDFTLSTFVIIFFLSWMIPLFAIIIKLESKGPIFFSQIRTGKNNQPFFCLKFRSMKPNHNADEIQATKEDFRITQFGKFIRKTSLDEFPQFINVLRGEMSIVGPRPLMIKHTNDYSKLVNQYMVRHFLKPGITGWAQINGYRGEIINNEQIINRVEKDIWYLENWNIHLDIKIILLTIYNVIKGEKNAY